MIDVEHLSKRYGDTLAVDDLSFQVRPGLVTGFLGPNGAGKSTTMRLIVGLDKPSAGSVTVNGRRPVDAVVAARRGARDGRPGQRRRSRADVALVAARAAGTPSL